jgi:hypothetical protein
VLGRETFANGAAWVDGWPVLGPELTPPSGGPFHEALTGPVPPPSWVAASRFPSDVLIWTPDGYRLRGPDVFAGRRQQHLYARVTARLDVRGVGGLSVRVDARHAIDLELADGRIRAVWAVGDVRHVLGSRPAGDVAWEIRMLPAEGHEFSTARGPDRVVAGVVEGGVFTALGEVDGRYLSTEVAGGMTGRLVGVRSVEGDVLIRSFVYVGADEDLP